MNVQKSIRILRIEEPNSHSGMWYNERGVLQRRIHILCPYGVAKDYPMPLNLELHRKDGEVWNSGCDSEALMRQWFTSEDARNLIVHGFKLFRYTTNMYQELENEVLFCRKGITAQEELDISAVWEYNV